MPLEIEQKNALFFFMSNRGSTRTSSKKHPAFTVVFLACVETWLQTVTQWILNGVKYIWGFAGSRVEITAVTLKGLRMSLNEASNMKQLCSGKESCVLLYSKNFVTHFTIWNAALSFMPLLIFWKNMLLQFWVISSFLSFFLSDTFNCLQIPNWYAYKLENNY